MGRMQKTRVNRDKNSYKLPQTPTRYKRVIGDVDEETLELAKELDKRYGRDENTWLPETDPEEIEEKDDNQQ